MTYIDYLNSFNAYTEWNVMSPATQVFYYKLLSVFNKAGWPEEVMLTNRQMETLIGHVSKQTVIRDRKALAAAGFIEYKGGSRGAGRYKLIEKNDRKCNTVDGGTACVTNNVTDNVTGRATNNVTDCGTDFVTNSVTNDVTDTLYKKTKIKTEKENSLSESSRKSFTPPTVEEVEAYCAENGYNVDARRFVDFYTAKGWYIGKTKMKDWKAAVRTWARSEPKGGERHGRRQADGAVPSEAEGKGGVDFGWGVSVDYDEVFGIKQHK